MPPQCNEPFPVSTTIIRRDGAKENRVIRAFPGMTKAELAMMASSGCEPGTKVCGGLTHGDLREVSFSSQNCHYGRLHG